MLEENRKEVIIQNLEDAGCSSKIIDDFLSLWKQNKIEDIYTLLRRYRASLLENIHKKQKEIDILDYLFLSLKNIK